MQRVDVQNVHMNCRKREAGVTPSMMFDDKYMYI